MTVLSLCLDCRTPTHGSRCPACARTRENERSARRGPSGWARQRSNAEVAAAAAGRCAICGRAANVIDHIEPLGLGGSDDRSNKRALCDECHQRETRRQFGK